MSDSTTIILSICAVLATISLAFIAVNLEKIEKHLRRLADRD